MSIVNAKSALSKLGVFSVLYVFLISSSLAAPTEVAENCSDDLKISSFYADPVLDLNGSVPSFDKNTQFSPTPTTLSSLVTVPTLTSDTGTILAATISFTGTVDATENLYSNYGGVNNFFPFNAAANTQSFIVNGTTIQVTQNFTDFTIAEIAGNPISNDDFLELINTFFYYNNTNTATVGVRTATFEVTDPNLATGSAQSIIRVFNTAPVAVDEGNNVNANEIATISGNVLTNDTGTNLTVTEVDVYPGQVNLPYSTLYGEIIIQSDGTYIYDVDEANLAVVGLKDTESLDDIISYTISDDIDIIDYGILTITIDGVNEAPDAQDNADSITVVTETDVSGNIITDEGVNGVDAIDRGLSTLVWENEFPTAGPNPMYSTPVDGQARNINAVQLDFFSTDIDNIGIPNQNQTVALTGSNGGHFGYLRFGIQASTNPVNDTELRITFDEPVFNLGFLIVDIDFSQAPVWQDQMQISGSLGGVASAYKFVTTGGVVIIGGDTFYGTGNAIESDATGNVNVVFEEPIDELVFSYNYGPNVTNNPPGGQIAGISDLYWQGKAEDVVVIEIDGEPVAIGGSVFVGTYGSIEVFPDGTYTYTPDISNPDVAGLLTGQTLTEDFTYVLSDGMDSDTANLVITLNGDKTAPTITIDTPIEGDGIVDSNEDDDVTISGTTTDVEDGQIVTVTFSDGVNIVTTTATVIGGVWTATDADISGLNNGSITVTADVTDFGGNPANDVESIVLGIPPVAQNDESLGNTPGATVSIDPTVDNGNGVDADPDGNLDVTSVSLIVPAGSTMVQMDADGDIIGYTVPGEGVWEVNPVNGEVSFAPLAGFNDDPTSPAIYTIDDNGGNTSNQATVTIDYVPVATADEVSGVMPGDPAVIDVLANDLDGDLVDPTTVMIIDPVNPGVPVTSLLEPGVGVWSVDPVSGAITFTPCSAAGVPDASCTGLFEGSPMDISYVVSDNEGNLTTPAKISAAYAVPPVAQNDESLANTPGATVSLDPTADNGFGVDADPDGTLDVTSVSLVVPVGATMEILDADGDIIGYTVPEEGAWEVSETTGQISFIPLADFNDDPTNPASYTIDDNDGNPSNTATVTIDYVPVATSDVSAGNDTGLPVVVDVLANDVDGDVVDPSTVQIVGTANPGEDLVVVGEGTWSVDPVSGAITFTPCTVVSLPDCPEIFTANPTDIEYVVADGEGNVTSPASVSVSFIPEPPVAMDDASVNNMTGDPVLIDVALNDMDPDGTLDLTTVQIVGTANPGDDLVEPGVGVWSVDPVSGAITFTPCSATGVPDASCVGVSTQDPQDISYTIKDNDGNVSNAATVSVMYDAEPPVAQNDESLANTPGATVSLDPTADNGFGIDADPDGTLDVTSVSLVVPAGATMVQTDADGDIIGYTVPGEGVWEVNPVTGEISFAPLAGFNDDPTNPASYTIDDNDGNPSNVAAVTIDYVPVSTLDESAGNDTGLPVVVDVLANDVDGDVVDPTTVQIVGTTNPGDDLVVVGEGTWSVDPVSGAITFTPCTVVLLPDCPEIFTADPTDIEYVVADNEGNVTDPASVSVSFIPEPPVAMDDASNNNMTGDSVLIDVAGNDMDPDGTLDLTTVQIVGTANPGDDLVEPGVGVWSVDPVSGAITFTPCSVAGVPDASCVGVSTQDPQDISYTINDNDGNVSNAATVSVMYDAEPPVAQNDESLANTPGATVSLDPTADNGFGIDADPDGTLDVTTVSFVVPVGALDVAIDANGDVTGYTVPGEGSWQVNPITGTISFIPLAGFNDDPTNPASYTIDDNDGNTSNAATITVDYVPVATADVNADNTTGLPVVVDVLANDVNGDIVDPSTVQIVGTTNPGDDLVDPGVGVWSVDPVTGAITFTPCTAAGIPDATCTGLSVEDPAPISYTVMDNDGNISDPAEVSVSFDECNGQGLGDCDGDGVSNDDEVNGGTDPNDPCSYNDMDQDLAIVTSEWNSIDCDMDGLTNNEETTGIDDPLTPNDPNGNTTDPQNPDTDGDGVTDGDEAGDMTDPNDPCALEIASQTVTPTMAWNDLDCDMDGLNNGEELTGIDDPTTPGDPNGNITDPLDIDSDGDGVTDGQEALDGTDPNDNCSLVVANQTEMTDAAYNSADCDMDGLTNSEETTGIDDPSTPNDPNGNTTDPQNPDTDGDGVTDGDEAGDMTDPNDPCDLQVSSQSVDPSQMWNDLDCDLDGLTNAEEITGTDDPDTPADPNGNTTDPTNPDTDGDGVSDGDEAEDKTDPNSPCDFLIDSVTLPMDTDFASLDCDGDGVTNADEIADGTDPFDVCDLVADSQTVTTTAEFNNADCDNDGLTNEEEITGIDNPLTPSDPNGNTTDPTNPDTDGDGVSDGREGLDGTDPNNSCSLEVSSQTLAASQEFLDGDCDGDGILNGEELGDENDNGIPDFLEVNNGNPDATDGLEVFDIMTPNGDGLNDVFVIRGIEQYPNNKLRIYNRWGVLVWDADGYGQDNVFFRGESNGRVVVDQERLLPVGAYYYVLDYTNDAGSLKQLAGPLYINR